MSQTLSTISTKGKAFVDQSGNRFMARGIALTANMQNTRTKAEPDLLADNYSDYLGKYILPRLLELNVNVVRVYQLDETQNHGKAMDLLASHCIYAMLDLGLPDVSVHRIDPQYTPAIHNRFTKLVSEFCAYDNTFAFSVGNEVVFPGIIYHDESVNQNAGLANEIILKDAAVMKSIIRDMKAHMRDNKLRAVPVGMAMQDGPSETLPWGGIGTETVAQYYVAGDAAERADYIGINEYRYLNTANPGPMHAYDGLARDAANYPVPVILTESGGITRDPNTHQPMYKRDWQIIPELYSSPLLYQNLSGTVAFKFFLKNEKFGMYVEEPPVSPNPFTGGAPALAATPLGGADTLAAVFDKVKDMVPPMPTPVADPASSPARCNPALLPSPAATINVTILNYADVALKVVQGGTVIAELPIGSGNEPTSSQVTANASSDLLLQQNKGNNWIPVCKVPASLIVNGMVIKNDLAWGNNAMCNIS